MKTLVLIQHRTSKRFLAPLPSPESTGVHEVLAPVNAAHYASRELAERERDLLAEFKDTYEVVEVTL